MKAARVLFAWTAMLLAGWTGAQAADTVLLKGRILSSRYLRSLSAVEETAPGFKTTNLDALMSVRIKIDAVLIGRWPARIARAQLHMTHPVTPGTAIYVVLESRGRTQHAVAWDFADHGVCLTPAQQAEYGIDPATLPTDDRCNPD